MKALKITGSVSFYIFILLMPFYLLIGLSLFLYKSYGINIHLGVIISTICVSGILTFYLSYLYYKFFPQKFGWSSFKIKMVVSLLVVAIYGGSGLIYLSPLHFKSSSISATYQSLHPGIRLAVSTLVWLDSDLVITDTSRTPDDYLKMGLTPRESSLHFEQSDGYVHALDIRTNDRWEIRNWLIQGYFEALGLETLRHTGTADHLHVSLR